MNKMVLKDLDGMRSEKLDELLIYYNNLIPQIYSKGNFPKDFELRPLDWALTDDVIERPNIETLIDGELKSIRPIGILDVELLSNEIIELAKIGKVDLGMSYPCGLKCPGCFSEEEIYGDADQLMKWQDVMSVIDDAIGIGLTSIKFLGPGELFQNPDMFDILNATKERNLPFSIFTKGAELGDDELARKTFQDIGIKTAEELVNRIAEYDNVRILLGYNSIYAKKQDRMVGSSLQKLNYEIKDGTFINRGIADYTTKRNKALVNLVKAGFNDPEKGQRLSLIAAPVGLDQIDEIPDVYVLFAERNIPLVIAPTMESGPKSIGLRNYNLKIDSDQEKLKQMMLAVHEKAIDYGIISKEMLLKEGASAYMGTSPCNQVANGLYMRLNGTIQLCPGRSDNLAIYGNVREESITKIWYNSPNYSMGPLKNNWCAAKTVGMPGLLKIQVEKDIKQLKQI